MVVHGPQLAMASFFRGCSFYSTIFLPQSLGDPGSDVAPRPKKQFAFAFGGSFHSEASSLDNIALVEELRLGK